MKRTFLKAGFLFRTCLFFFLLILSLEWSAQVKRIAGVIVDEKGQPAADVTVSFKGKTEATFTDARGRFAISANN